MQQHKNPLELVDHHPDPELLAEAARLLDEIRSGEVVGLIYITVSKGPGYTGNVVGRLRAMPIYAAGLLEALKLKILELVE